MIIRSTTANFTSCQRLASVEEKRLKDKIIHRIRILGNRALNQTCQYLSLYDAIYSENKKIDTLTKFAECQDIGLKVGAALGSLSKFVDTYIGKMLAKKTGVKCRLFYMLVCATGLVLLEWFCVKLREEIIRRKACRMPENQNNVETDSVPVQTSTTCATITTTTTTNTNTNTNPTTPTFSQVAWDSLSGVLLNRRTASESSVPASVRRVSNVNVCAPCPLSKTKKIENIPLVVIDSGRVQNQQTQYLEIV